MSKKIVIDKEDWDSIKRQFPININIAEIDTDQSIEDRAKECYPKMIGTNSVGVGYDMNWREKEAYIKGATEQYLISKAREKYIVLKLINQLKYHNNLGMVLGMDCEVIKEAEELFNQFTNR